MRSRLGHDANLFPARRKTIGTVAQWSERTVSGSGNTATPSSTGNVSRRAPLVRFAFAPVLIWRRYEPRPLGEVAFVVPEIATAWLLARGPDSPNDSAKLVHLSRQTPTGSSRRPVRTKRRLAMREKYWGDLSHLHRMAGLRRSRHFVQVKRWVSMTVGSP